MALEGYTSFVIEGEKGKEIYDQIMNLKSQCELQKEEGIAVASAISNQEPLAYVRLSRRCV